MTKAFALGLVLFAQLALAAGPRRYNPAPVNDMTCAQAQAVASINGEYWKFVGNDFIHIYGLKKIEDTRCGRKEFAAPIFEAVLDNDVCVLGYYCRSQ